LCTNNFIISALIYYVLIKPLSLLPLWALYVFSDIIYFTLYKVFGYRTKVIRRNLHNSFPSKSAKELKEIEIKFYHHLCDLIVESIKLFSLSQKEAERRLVFTNRELVDEYFNKGQSVIVIGAHYGNWEYVATISNLKLKHQLAGLYTILSNKFFENKMRESRGKYGMMLVSTKDVKKFYSNQPDIPNMMIFGSDQSPTFSKNVHWTQFLNQDTAVAFGAEKYAKEYNYPVLYGGLTKVKRGFYEVEFTLVEDNPQQTKQGEITENHVRILEDQINKQPEYWLWTHKRWKRKR